MQINLRRAQSFLFSYCKLLSKHELATGELGFFQIHRQVLGIYSRSAIVRKNFPSGGSRLLLFKKVHWIVWSGGYLQVKKIHFAKVAKHSTDRTGTKQLL